MKTVQRLLLVVASLLPLTSSAKIITAAGNIVKSERKLSGFTKISVDKGLTVNVTMSNLEGVTVQATENIQEYIETTIKNGTLVIHLKDNERIQWQGEMTPLISVSIQSLQSAQLASGAMMMVNGSIQVNKFDLGASGGSIFDGSIKAEDVSMAISGSSKITANVQAKRLDAQCSSASLAELQGKVEIYTLTTSGASIINSANLVSQKAQITASGASIIRLTTDTKEFKVSASGASIIYVQDTSGNKGKAGKQQLSGGSQVIVETE